MRLTHKQKVKMARRMRTREEVKNKTPIFQTEAWDRRKEAKEVKVRKLRNKKDGTK